MHTSFYMRLITYAYLSHTVLLIQLLRDREPLVSWSGLRRDLQYVKRGLASRLPTSCTKWHDLMVRACVRE